MSSAICFNLDQYKILSSGNGLKQSSTKLLVHINNTVKTGLLSHNFFFPKLLFHKVSIESRRSLVRSPAHPTFFPRTDDSHCNRIHSFLTTVRYFNNGYVGKQPVALKEYCAEYWLKKLQESMDRCTGHRDINEIVLKTALNTILSINQPYGQ